ncbi:tripartite ATP-independent transporter solute receptor, DctP family [Succinivibrio dextrinosolvens]|uniref:C4-dicarboxylate TRAP transporter substrate-binding protein n=1 Tax=Succinivibrio dextrinosolvens TaxID=83771 RepID=UPI0008E678AA|nr:C4-dicarboxylate TRAP transporter substrate-binding protein [Succinivibrio dextrinosolvens]SFS71514.1 tripartite ATP-independent transporter solute receptor, DctP family [Succinivibrio dextrinosolvens]
MKNILTKATLAACLAAVMTIGASAAQADDTVVLRVGYANNPGEPFDLGCQKWKEIIEERSGGKFKIELYPSSQLGSKDDVMDQMVAGEPVCTLTDGAFFYDRGVKDLGIVFGPFLFNTWDEAFKLNSSQWYQDQAKLVEEKAHLKIIGTDWKYGARHTLTTKPVNKVEDFKGMKIRVPTNNIQVKGFEVLGATPTPMALGEVYTSLQQGTIDGVENPLAVLYNGKFHEVAKYLLLDGHVFNITNIVVGTDFYNSLTPEQQKLLVETCHEAAMYQNKIVDDSEADILAKFKAEGVTVVEPSPEFKQSLIDTSKKFYSLPDFKDWTPGLYDTVKKAMQ